MRMKILILVNISLTLFYVYIIIYRKILVHILTQNINDIKID